MVLGVPGMLEDWLKFQVCWWTYLALTLAMSLIGVQRACIATDATIGCWMVCFENARCASQSDPCLAKFKLLYPASSQLMGHHNSEVGKFLQVCIPDTTISCCRLCHSTCQMISVIEFGAIMNKMVSDSMYQVRTSKVFFGGHCCSSHC